jgi:hypothetical protein
MEPAMTILAEKNHARRSLIQEHPATGMGTPEFQAFAKSVLSTIGAIFSLVAKKGAQALRYVGKKLDEGAEIHRRQTLAKEERYQRNWDRFTSML